MLGSYNHLEKRFGSGDIPPEKEDGYKLDYSGFPEGIRLTPDEEKGLLKTFHASGMTNKQVQTVLNKYADVIKTGITMQQEQEAGRVNEVLNTVVSEFKQSWGNEFDSNLSAVKRGFAHLADEADIADMPKIGADPKVTYRLYMKMLAKVGAGITEDTGIVLAEGATIQSTREELMKSPAYLDGNHPDHKATVAKVTALYNKQYPGKGAHISAITPTPAAK